MRTLEFKARMTLAVPEHLSPPSQTARISRLSYSSNHLATRSKPIAMHGEISLRANY